MEFCDTAQFFVLYHTANVHKLPKDTMASHREISKLTTDMNTITCSGTPLRNSQGILITSQHPARYTTLQSEAQSVSVNPQFSRSVLTENESHQVSGSTSTPPSQSKVEALTPCMRQNDRFVNPSGNPLLLGTIIVCNDLPFVVSNNGKIYNFMGGSMKQLYITDPSECDFLITSANSPSTLSNIFSSVLGLFPRFSNRQGNTNKHKIKTRSNLQLRLEI